MSQFTVNVNDFICPNESKIQFDKDVVSKDFTTIDGGDDVVMNFGIVNLKIKKTNPITQKRHFVFSVDCSGSMNDLCNDGRTKNHHSNHTLINMISYFAEHPELMVSITVFAFDGSIYTIIENQDVKEENLDKLIQDIKKIRPKDLTNIEKALINSREYIVNYCSENLDSHVTHIFMTDGDATQGNMIPSILKELVTPLVSNIFIGFGIEHNAYLLKELSTHDKNSYYFVDALEKAGLVYGEILHSILYRTLENTSISVVNGFVYDWKKNSWVNEIYMGDLVSESNKIIHVLSSNPSEFSCVIQGNFCISKEVFNLTIQNTMKNENNHVDFVELTDLTKYKYRQRTQQLLYEANLHNFNKLKCKDPLKFTPSHIDDYDNFCKKYYENGSLLEAKMKNLLEEMQQILLSSLENTDSKEPNLIKLLCDDIYICLQTMNTTYGAMYSCARQTSQGAQRSYSATYTPKFKKDTTVPRTFQMTRSYAINSTLPDFTIDDINLSNYNDTFYNNNNNNDNNDDNNDNNDDNNDTNDDNNDNNADNNDNEYTVSDQIDNPYSTLSILELMRSCSASVDDSKMN
jgi:hypothetical protein